MLKLLSVAFALLFFQTMVFPGAIGSPVVIVRVPQLSGVASVAGLLPAVPGMLSKLPIPREVSDSESAISAREPQLGGLGGVTSLVGPVAGLLAPVAGLTKGLPVPGLKRSEEMD